MGHSLPEVLQRRSEEAGNVVGKLASGPWPLVVGPSLKRSISKLDVEIVAGAIRESLSTDCLKAWARSQGPTTNDGFILSPSSVLVAIPVPFSQLPALLMMPITRANPASTLIGRVVPASRHPLIATSLRRPVAIDPGIARTRNGTASLVANPRRRMSYVHGDLSCGGHSKRSGEQYTADQIQFHFCSLPSLNIGG